MHYCFIRLRRLSVGRLMLSALAAFALMLPLVAVAAPADANAKPATKRLTHAVVKRIVRHDGNARTASVSDPSLFANRSTTTLQTFPWYVGGGSCTASGSALWTRGSNLLSLNGSAHTSAPFRACRARLRVNYWATDSGYNYYLGSTSADIPTACANTDPSCPSTQPLNVVIPNALQGTFFGIPKTLMVDHITLGAELR